MALNTFNSTSGGANKLTNEQRTWYSLMLIKRLLPRLVMFQDAQLKTIPGNQGGFQSASLQWRKFSALSVATTPLTEGVAPTPGSLTVSTVTSNLAQYGATVSMTDVLLGASIDDVMREAQDLLAEQAGQTLHQIVIAELKNSTNAQYANGKAARTDLVSTDVITSTEIKKAVRTLSTNKAPRYPDGYYHGLISPSVAFDLAADEDWHDLAINWGGESKSGGPDMIGGMALDGFIGSIHGVRFRMSTEAPSYTTPTTYGTFIYGPDWFGMFDFPKQTVGSINPQTNMGMDVSVLGLNDRDKSDPLGQTAIAGWKVAFATKILDDARGVLVHTGSSS